jgi:hypothetical protein
MAVICGRQTGVANVTLDCYVLDEGQRTMQFRVEPYPGK